MRAHFVGCFINSRRVIGFGFFEIKKKTFLQKNVRQISRMMPMNGLKKTFPSHLLKVIVAHPLWSEIEERGRHYFKIEAFRSDGLQ